jgi:hypothetical protein
MHLHLVQIRVRVRFRRRFSDVQLVVRVRVDVEAGPDHGVESFVRGREWDRHMAKPRTGHRIGDECALVADDRILEARCLEIGAHRLKHPAGDDDHVGTCGAHQPDSLARPRPELTVGRDQRTVEVARERGDALRESLREAERYGAVPPVDFTT